MISEIDIRDWDRAEKIIDSLEVSNPEVFTNHALNSEDYVFLMNLVRTARSTVTKPKLPAILTWWKA